MEKTPAAHSTWSSSLPSVFRPGDLGALGVPRGRLRALIRRGEAERIGRGLYRLRNAVPSEHETIAMVTKRVPGAIVCLLTALHVHGIGTQAPRAVWIAIDRKARKPRIDTPPSVPPRGRAGLAVRIVRFSGPMLHYGVVTLDVQGVPIRITSPARTIVDCFRYRRKIGLDVALEALRDGLRSRVARADEILRAAEVCRARSVIQPYLESLTG